MELSEFVNRHLSFNAERDALFLNMARVLSRSSFDPSTKCGALIVDSKGNIAGCGINNIPDRFKMAYRDRSEKYKRIVHAEIWAILESSLDPNEKYTLYTWPSMPCCECVKHVVAVGINRCVFPKATDDYMSRWSEACKITLQLLEEANINYSEYNPEYL